MNEKDKLILKRNQNSEMELNYKKIYDLSKLDKIPSINPENKFLLLSTIKKILLCTNNYIDICNTKEFLQYILVSFCIFILYITVLSPFYEIVVLSEERINSLGNYTFVNKLWHYFLGLIIEIIFRIIFNNLRKRKVNKLMTYYARNELNKIRNEFNINIDENNFDLTIDYKKNKYNNDIIKFENDFQYIICYPNVRYYDWDENILNKNEKELCQELKNHIKISEDNFILKNYVHSIIILVLYLTKFFFLTNKNLLIYYFIVFIFFSYTKIVSFILSSKYKQVLTFSERYMNHKYIKQGYLIILNSSIIHIFKLNPLEYYNGELDFDIYMSFLEKVEKLNKENSILSFF